MTTHIALLRGVNVGGNKKVAMAQLRELLSALGLRDVQTLLQSGNAVFRSQGHKPAQLERLLEVQAHDQLHVECDYMVRTAQEWAAIIARNPFAAEAKRDPSHLLVMCLKAAPTAAAAKALQAAIVGREQVRVDGREAFLVYPDGIGTSRLTNLLIEKVLQTRGTARNWNTVMKLAALVEA